MKVKDVLPIYGTVSQFLLSFMLLLSFTFGLNLFLRNLFLQLFRFYLGIHFDENFLIWNFLDKALTNISIIQTESK